MLQLVKMSSFLCILGTAIKQIHHDLCMPQNFAIMSSNGWKVGKIKEKSIAAVQSSNKNALELGYHWWTGILMIFKYS